jgi:hypothetical protein
MDNDSITRIFCDVDDFCARLERYCTARLLPPSGTGRRGFPKPSGAQRFHPASSTKLRNVLYWVDYGNLCGPLRGRGGAGYRQ